MNKTGTSTIRQCFETLRLLPVASPEVYGYKTQKRIYHFYKYKNYEDMLELADAYRCFEDRPWNMWSMYLHLDRHFPNSLFILTERDPESWWRSTERWIKVTKPHMSDLYQLHLRAEQPDGSAMKAAYIRYNQEVREYFEGSSRLLVMDLEAGDGWKKLCSFLRVPVPDKPFPHSNRQEYSERDSSRWEAERLVKHGVDCQACGHITDLREHERFARISAAPSAVKKLVGRLLPGAIGQRYLGKLTGKRFENWGKSRRALYTLSQIRRTVSEPRGLFRQLPPLQEKQLAVVSCFFNPSGSRQRLNNFNRFVQGIQESGVRLLVVELAFGSSPHQITSHEDVIRVRSDDVMWHKEKLLNLGIKRLLSESYQNIAWLDGDILFDEPDWPQLIVRELQEANLCQVFSEASIHTHISGAPVVGSSAVKYFRESGGALYAQPRRGMADLLRGRLRGGFSGFGWAARAEVLEKVLLYENALVGGADKLILAASLVRDVSDESVLRLSQSRIACAQCGHKNHSQAYTRSCLEWSERWSAAVASKVSYAPVHIRDMYHGSRTDRGYNTRHEILYRHQFDPATDLKVSDEGCWCWASDKPGLHRDVEAYFMSRREDVAS